MHPLVYIGAEVEIENNEKISEEIIECSQS
jgi:hypothetical protein